MPSPPNKPQKSLLRRLVGLTFVLGWTAVIAMAIVHRQDIVDWWKLHNYQAPAEVASLATQDTMTDRARKVFYVNQPAVLDKTDFANSCPAGDKSEQTIVLGCYHGNQNGIYVLKVSDSRLDGVQQVTAAHEMLHAAYDRLSGSERHRVDAMLQDFYANHLTDKRVIKTIEAYKHSEPNDVVNEMHSIFGTEVATLTPDLEIYYRQYFDNRSAIAAYAAKYQGEFTSRQQLVDRDDARLAALKQQIDTMTGYLKTKLDDINSEQGRLHNLRASGEVEAYNAAVPGFNAMVTDYNRGIDQLKGLISTYNQLVADRNAVALEADQLTKELSSDVQRINN